MADSAQTATLTGVATADRIQQLEQLLASLKAGTLTGESVWTELDKVSSAAKASIRADKAQASSKARQEYADGLAVQVLAACQAVFTPDVVKAWEEKNLASVRLYISPSTHLPSADARLVAVVKGTGSPSSGGVSASPRDGTGPNATMGKASAYTLVLTRKPDWKARDQASAREDARKAAGAGSYGGDAGKAYNHIMDNVVKNRTIREAVKAGVVTLADIRAVYPTFRLASNGA